MEEYNFNENSNSQSNNTHPTNKRTTAFVVLVAAVVIAIIVIVIVCVTLPDSNGNSIVNSDSYLSYSNFSKIHNGMTYSEVVDILDGNKGELSTSSSYSGYTLAYYNWSNSSGTKCIVVGFENNKVCAKTQYGLE